MKLYNAIPEVSDSGKQELFNKLRDNELNFHKQILKNQEKVIEEALIKAGFSKEYALAHPEDFTLVIKEGDKFQHLYCRAGTPEEKRIISIERFPNMNYDYSMNNNKFSISTETKYY